MNPTVRRILRTLHVFLLLGGVLFYVGLGVWASQFRTSFSISGHVEDADTGRRVSHAKVVVTAWKWWGFHSSPYKFGTVADDQGNFRISAAPGFFVAWCDIMASSPDNKYAETLELKHNYAPLGVRPLTYWQRESDVYHYQSFEGSWVGKTTWTKQQ